jgi:hypothetical protein
MQLPEVPDDIDHDPSLEIRGMDSRLTAHVRDRTIMEPLLAAKKRRLDSGCTQIDITGTRGTRLCADVYACQQDGRLSGLSFDTNSGTNVREKKQLCAVILHGFTDSSAGMAYLAEEYIRNGIPAIVLNLRAHGYSDGKLVGGGYRDALDLCFWMKELFRRFPGYRFILHGVSMGAAAINLYAGLPITRKHPENSSIACLVSDCSFSSFSAQMKPQLEITLPGNGLQKGIRYLMRTGASLINLVANGFPFARISPEKALSRRHQGKPCVVPRQVPLILFQGIQDSLVPCLMGRRLFYAANTGIPAQANRYPDKTTEKKQKLFQIESSADTKTYLVLVQGAPHIGCYFYAPEEYFRMITEVAQKNGL